MNHHQHFCDYAGHYWHCAGNAQRPLAGDTQESICMCAMHQEALTAGDHNECPVELLACPEHRDAQLQAIGTCDTDDSSECLANVESNLLRDDKGGPIIGFCLWCDRDFHSMAEANAHNADGLEECMVYQELKNEDCGPPVLLELLKVDG